jgi:hypothetical protein
MTAVTRPRGPLPPRVYWTRRLLVLLVALALVFGVARLLGGGGPGGGAPSARPVGAEQSTTAATTGPTPTATTTGATGSAGPSTSPSGPATGQSSGASPSAPATPSGTCANSDIVALPSVASPAYAGHTVIVTMTLTTKSSPACTWQVSADSLVVKVTTGDERFWSTQDCADAVPDQSVVVRRDTPTTIAMQWNAMRSDKDCSNSTSWAQPGYYHVVAAAFGAEPTDTQFRLLAPVRETITASPTQSPSGTATPGRTATPSGSASPRR